MLLHFWEFTPLVVYQNVLKTRVSYCFLHFIVFNWYLMKLGPMYRTSYVRFIIRHSKATQWFWSNKFVQNGGKSVSSVLCERSLTWRSRTPDYSDYLFREQQINTFVNGQQMKCFAMDNGVFYSVISSVASTEKSLKPQFNNWKMSSGRPICGSASELTEVYMWNLS